MIFLHLFQNRDSFSEIVSFFGVFSVFSGSVFVSSVSFDLSVSCFSVIVASVFLVSDSAVFASFASG